MWQRIRVQLALPMPERSVSSTLFQAPIVMFASGTENMGAAGTVPDQSEVLSPSQPQYSAMKLRESPAFAFVQKNFRVAFVMVALSGMDDVSHRSRRLRTTYLEP